MFRRDLEQTPSDWAVVTAQDILEALAEVQLGWFDEAEVQRYTQTPSSMLPISATIPGWVRHMKAVATAAGADRAAQTTAASSPFMHLGVVQAMQACNRCAWPLGSVSTVVLAG